MGLHYLNGEIVDDDNPLSIAIVGIRGTVAVQEEDGSPNVAAGTIKFPNGSVTDHGSGVVSVAFPADVDTHAILSATHTDTTVSTPTDQDVLTWDAGTSKWIAQALPTDVDTTISQDDGSVAVDSDGIVTATPTGGQAIVLRSGFLDGGPQDTPTAQFLKIISRNWDFGSEPSDTLMLVVDENAEEVALSNGTQLSFHDADSPSNEWFFYNTGGGLALRRVEGSSGFHVLDITAAPGESTATLTVPAGHTLFLKRDSAATALAVAADGSISIRCNGVPVVTVDAAGAITLLSAAGADNDSGNGGNAAAIAITGANGGSASANDDNGGDGANIALTPGAGGSGFGGGVSGSDGQVIAHVPTADPSVADALYAPNVAMLVSGPTKPTIVDNGASLGNALVALGLVTDGR